MTSNYRPKILALILAVFVTAATLMTAAVTGSPQVNRPNILFILSDDLDMPTLERMLSLGLMPNFQREMIDKGTTFSNAYVTTPLCCPSRATMLTGQYTHNHQVLANFGVFGGADALKEGQTLPVWLKEAGYRTGYVGKYLNSYGSETHRQHIPAGWDFWYVPPSAWAYIMYDYQVNDNGQIKKVSPGVYQTGNYGVAAWSFLTDNGPWGSRDSQPWFLYVSALAPHSENRQASCTMQDGRTVNTIRPEPRYNNTASGISLPQDSPSFNEEDVRDKPPPFRNLAPMSEEQMGCIEEFYQARIEAMRSVDDLVGDLVTTLTLENEIDNTVIIFASDNGFMLGQHRYVGKFWPYQEAIRIPFYVRMPDGPGNNAVVPDLVLSTDIAPTIVEMAQAEASLEMDGRSILPLLGTEPPSFWRHQFLVEAYFEHERSAAYWGIHNGTSIYLERWDGWHEYYDLKTDPHQLNNWPSRAPQSMVDDLQELRYCRGLECLEIENR